MCSLSAVYPVPDDELHTRCIRGHTPKVYLSQKLTSYEIFQLYVNNGAFPFPTCSNLVRGLALIHSHLTQFRLEVHKGRGGNLSKTKCVFFPPRNFFNDKLNHPSLTNDSTNDDDLWLISPTKCNEVCSPERQELE